MANSLNYQLNQTQDDVTTLADKIYRQSSPAITRHEAWIRAVRMLANV